jgi:hypothetical protein
MDSDKQKDFAITAKSFCLFHGSDALRNQEADPGVSSSSGGESAPNR